MDRCEKNPGILDVVEGERAVDEIEGGLRQGQLVEIGTLVDDARARRGPRSREHSLGNIDAENGGCPLLLCPAAEPAETATEIGNMETA